MTTYTAKKSNLKAILLKNNTNVEALEKTTKIPQSQLNDYMSKKVMNVNTAMTISRELNCKIEDLYVWKTAE